MKIPLKPPTIANDPQLLPAFAIDGSFPTVKGEYVHWDKLRHLQPPADLTSETWWGLIKLARKVLYKPLPFTDYWGKPLVFATPDIVLQKLHTIDRNAGNIINNTGTVINSQLQDTYLIRSLMEEAITSSQLEGASTTRQVAKEMLQTRRKPRNLDERMIFNNYRAMQFIREIKAEKLTTGIILELHKILTEDTLKDPAAAGHLRTTDDIYVWDHNKILHTPPRAKELATRLNKLCLFANTAIDQHNFFIHPIIKAIVLHFMLAYDHPFVDGNGRTARALFYWSLAQQGYWLMEFISISSILRKTPSQYSRAFLYTETDENDVTYFILHQLDVIIQAITALHTYIDQQTAEITQLEQSIYNSERLRNKLNYRQIDLIKHALKHSHTHYHIATHQQAHNITYDTARTDLLKLEALGLFTKQKIGKAFVFVATRDLHKQLFLNNYIST